MNILQKLIDEAVRNSATIRADELRRVQKKLDAAERTLMNMGYYYGGGEFYHPPKPDMLQTRIINGTIAGDDKHSSLIPE